MTDVSDIDLKALITTWEKNPNLLGFRDAVLSCLHELQARRAAEAKAVEVDLPDYLRFGEPDMFPPAQK